MQFVYISMKRRNPTEMGKFRGSAENSAVPSNDVL